MVRASPTRCSSAEAPAPSGWTPCDTCGSWFGSPSRTSDPAAPLTLRTVANDSGRPRRRTGRRRCPPRPRAPTARTSRRPRPRSRTQPRHGPDRGPDALDPLVIARDVVVVRALGDAERHALRDARLGDGFEQVRDHAMRPRRQADALPGLDEVQDHPRPGVGLAGPGGPCTGRTVASRPRASRRPAASGFSPISASGAPTSTLRTRGSRRSRRSRAAAETARRPRRSRG